MGLMRKDGKFRRKVMAKEFLRGTLKVPYVLGDQYDERGILNSVKLDCSITYTCIHINRL